MDKAESYSLSCRKGKNKTHGAAVQLLLSLSLREHQEILLHVFKDLNNHCCYRSETMKPALANQQRIACLYSWDVHVLNDSEVRTLR